MTVAARQGTRFILAGAIMSLGELAVQEGSASEGTRLVTAFESPSPGTLGGLDPDERTHRDQCLAAARAALGNVAFALACAAGQAMTPAQAVAYALGG